MARIVREFQNQTELRRKEEARAKYNAADPKPDYEFNENWYIGTSTAYTDDGKVWRWTSNDAVCPLDACEDYGIPVDPVEQKRVQDKETQAFLADYRKRMENHVPDAEEMYEMRAAFGAGTEIVNVITGRRTRL